MNIEEARKITPEEWDQFPARPARAPDHWAPIMEALEQGEMYALPYRDDKDLRGKRIGLGRRASQRGFKLEIRTKDRTMAVRRAAAPATPPAPVAPVSGSSRRGRQRKESAAGVSASEGA